MQSIRENLRLIWADKIVLWMAITAAGLAAFTWLLAAVATGISGANHVVASLGTGGGSEVALGAFALWTTLRALDFVFHGSTWRLFHTNPALTERPLAVAAGLAAHQS